MVTLTIDNKQVSVPAGTTILDAARAVDIHIPTLCYLREINEVASCPGVRRGGGGGGPSWPPPATPWWKRAWWSTPIPSGSV